MNMMLQKDSLANLLWDRLKEGERPQIKANWEAIRITSLCGDGKGMEWKG